MILLLLKPVLQSPICIWYPKVGQFECQAQFHSFSKLDLCGLLHFGRDQFTKLDLRRNWWCVAQNWICILIKFECQAQFHSFSKQNLCRNWCIAQSRLLHFDQFSFCDLGQIYFAIWNKSFLQVGPTSQLLCCPNSTFAQSWLLNFDQFSLKE